MFADPPAALSEHEVQKSAAVRLEKDLPSELQNTPITCRWEQNNYRPGERTVIIGRLRLRDFEKPGDVWTV